jgi:hypothetical protein
MRPHKMPDEEPMSLEEVGHHFAYEVLDHLHEMIHEATDECIYTDEKYNPISIYAVEVITAMFMLANGDDSHPFCEIADEVFNESVDKGDDLGYNGKNVDNDEVE